MLESFDLLPAYDDQGHPVPTPSPGFLRWQDSALPMVETPAPNSTPLPLYSAVQSLSKSQRDRREFRLRGHPNKAHLTFRQAERYGM